VEAPALILYVAERLKNSVLAKEALNLLKNHTAKPRRAWPSPLVPFLLYRLEGSELDRLAQADQALRARYQCQASFFIGLNALRGGDRATFIARMRDAASNPQALLECEYFLARWEVQRNFPEPAFELPR
jgi:hypothetical protein